MIIDEIVYCLWISHKNEHHKLICMHMTYWFAYSCWIICAIIYWVRQIYQFKSIFLIETYQIITWRICESLINLNLYLFIAPSQSNNHLNHEISFPKKGIRFIYHRLIKMKMKKSVRRFSSFNNCHELINIF